MSQNPHQTPKEPESEHSPAQADELVHVPKGKSPFVWLILVGMLLLMLVTFSVTPSMNNACSGGRTADVVLRWQRPGRGTEALPVNDYWDIKRKIDGWYTITRNKRNISDREVVELYLNDCLAQDAGIQITDAELGEILRAQGFDANPQFYDNITRQFFGSKQGFEEFFRKLVRVNRYQELMDMLASNADPASVESLWTKERQQLSIEYVEIERAAFIDSAKAALPADAELEKWLTDLPEGEKAGWKSLARSKAVLAGVRSAAPRDTAALFAKYPRAADADAEKLAKDFYNANFYLRYRRETPLPADPAALNSNTQEDFQRRFYKSFDEIAEQVRTDAALHEALGKWRADLAKRQEAGEAIDLAAEAATLGLESFAPEGMLTQDEWTKVEDWGGSFFGWRLIEAASGKVFDDVVMNDKALLIAQCIEKRQAELPPFSELKDKVAERWIEKRAGELALAKLNEVRSQFLPKPPAVDTGKAITDSAAFSAAAGAAGLTVGRRDGYDFEAPIASGDTSDVSQFLRTRRNLLSSEAGEVLEPQAHAGGAKLYLLRLEGRTPQDLARMTPSDFQSLEMRANGEYGRALRERLFAFEALMARYSVENIDNALNLAKPTDAQGG
ncbi:MAG: hypothetical protein FJ299_10995 [Planctomycetes bacterium]|nr:hypothetical protein [Planctomycetota bacterium]